MCGIVTAIQLKPDFDCPKFVWEQFDSQRNRGTQGFGFVAVKNGKVEWVKTTGEDDIKYALENLGNVEVLIFHHRIPTCTPNSIPGNHPILIANKKFLKNKYFIIHNGVISNADGLAKIHERFGYNYRTRSRFKFTEYARDWEDTFTDSESLGIEMAMYIEGSSNLMAAQGAVACFLLEMDRKNKPIAVHYYRNSSPTKFYRNESAMFFSSEGKGQPTKTGVLYTIDLATKKVSQRDVVTEIKKEPTAPVCEKHKKKVSNVLVDASSVITSVARGNTVTTPPPLPPSRSSDVQGLLLPRRPKILKSDRGLPTNLVVGEHGILDLENIYENTKNLGLKDLITRRRNLVRLIEDNADSAKLYERDLDSPDNRAVIENIYSEMMDQMGEVENLDKEIQDELELDIQSIMQ